MKYTPNQENEQIRKERNKELARAKANGRANRKQLNRFRWTSLDYLQAVEQAN
jgi:hypothetical protein